MCVCVCVCARVCMYVCVTAEENSLGWYVKNHIQPLIVAVRIRNNNHKQLLSKTSTQPKEFNKLNNEERIKNWKMKAMHGQYVRKIEDKYKSNTWKRLRKIDLKGCTEALTFSAQEQALRTNYVKFHIDRTAESALCKMSRVENGAVSHIVSECRMLAQKKYKRGKKMYAGIFVGDYAKKHLRKHHSGTSMSQMEL